MGQSNALKLRFDAFDLDEADARLKRDGKPVALPPKAFGVLCALARQPGALVLMQTRSSWSQVSTNV